MKGNVINLMDGAQEEKRQLGEVIEKISATHKAIQKALEGAKALKSYLEEEKQQLGGH